MTMEYLKPRAWPVLGYQIDEFPLFTHEPAAFRSIIALTSPFEIAQILRTKWDLGLERRRDYRESDS
jgi:pseudouridine-5'-phosphate glycosidase